jgi:hypothetical protein
MRELKQKLLNSLMEQEIYQRKISDQIAATAKLGIEKQVTQCRYHKTNRIGGRTEH